MTACWPTTTLGEHISLLTGFAFKSRDFTEDVDDVRLLRGANIGQGCLKWAQERRLPHSIAAGYKMFELGPEDIVLAMDRPWIEAGLKWSAVRKADLPMLLVQRVARLRASGSLTQGYLRCLIGSPQFEAYVRPIVTGVNVPHISPTQILDFAFGLPPRDIQEKVASVLCAIDDLIDNNWRRIEILEESVRLTYREWFVHFRFPGHEEVELADSDFGAIPVGWSTGQFSDLVSEITSTIPPEDIKMGTPVVGLEHMPRRSTTLHEWESATHVGSRRKVFLEGDILFGKIRPYFHKVVDAPVSGCSSTDAIVFRPERDLFRSRALAVASSVEFVSVATATSNGTRMPRANTAVLLAYGIPHPTREIEQVFSETVGPMDSLRNVLAAQNRKLREARDLLLPCLISGELDASDLDLDLSAATA